MKHITTLKTIFRKLKTGETIAIFPECAGTQAWYKDCLSYTHDGGTSEGGYIPFDLELLSKTKTCSREDAKPLITELTRKGHKLAIITRIDASHMTIRKMAIVTTK